MKALKFPVILLITILAAFTSCEKDTIEKPEETLSFVDSIAGVWLKKKVLLDGAERMEWDDFQLTIEKISDSTGSFSVNESFYNEVASKIEGMQAVWPKESSWTLEPNKKWYHKLIREDSLEITVVIEDEGLRLSFPGLPCQTPELPPICDSIPDHETCFELLCFSGTWDFYFEREQPL